MSDNTTRTCQACWREFTPVNARNIYCSDHCRKQAWSQRKQHDTTPAATTAGAHRAPQPQPAATRDCPHCGEPITIVALLTTPEAARPSTPIDGTIVPLQRRTC
ncbi:Uncharacterised protein [Mycobacteroides abscessus subsp. abscessus]|uniref:hypothetical protein n=1 Tax=Mycobacteroides abscessus TaxID=36809 RepID=UPI00092B5A1A|nr:hypothetical protein [Mycobacteroides abscessus]SHU72649.1 Uncharacterised protein [Mycobacteroides abscessus subsp. abscessus]